MEKSLYDVIGLLVDDVTREFGGYSMEDASRHLSSNFLVDRK